MTPEHQLDDAVEILRFTSTEARVLLTCEHASERLPPPFVWPEGDASLRGTHWAFDLGARALSVELAHELGCTAVLSRFSRLLADPNRPAEAPDFIRAVAEGRPVELNRSITPPELEPRLQLWRRYHEAVDDEVRRSNAGLLLSVHTFTPVYEGTPREVEVGVLFDEEEELALGLQQSLREASLRVELNEPYSGRAGLMYSVDRHARSHGRRALEIEVRQDLAVSGPARRRVVEAVTRWLELAAFAALVS